MSKLPVAEIISESMKFPFVNFLKLLKRTIVAIVLFPIALISALVIAAPANGTDAAIQESAPQLAMVLLLFIPVFLVIMATVHNGVIQICNDHPLGDRWFSLGSREARLLLYLPLSFGIMALALLLSAMFGGIAGIMFGGSEDANVIGYLVGIPIFIAVGVFLSYRLIPLSGFIAVENEFAVSKAWDASRGNFWRILGSVFAVLLLWSVLFMGLQTVAAVLTGGEIAQSVMTFETQEEQKLSLTELSPLAIFITLLFLPAQLMFYGSSLAVYGYIYKHLSQEDAPAEEAHSAA